MQSEAITLHARQAQASLDSSEIEAASSSLAVNAESVLRVEAMANLQVAHVAEKALETHAVQLEAQRMLQPLQLERELAAVEVQVRVSLDPDPHTPSTAIAGSRKGPCLRVQDRSRPLLSASAQHDAQASAASAASSQLSPPPRVASASFDGMVEYTGRFPAVHAPPACSPVQSAGAIPEASCGPSHGPSPARRRIYERVDLATFIDVVRLEL